MKVLLADDDAVSRRLLEATLRRWNYEVVLASDGLEAWNVLEGENAPSLAILDWMMPEMTGPEVCRRVRERAREPYTYILLLTARTAKDDVVAGMESGADDYVTKPFDTHELEVRLRAGKRILDLQAQLLAAREKLRFQASRDALTGLWNRSHVFEILESEFQRATREDRPLSIAIADLDHFKHINDTYGHQVGDAVLREAAARLTRSTRRYDAVGRYGGEEFLLVLPGVREENCRKYGERLRKLISTPPVAVDGLTLPITVSIGITCSTTGHAADVNEMVAVADEALYAAKRAGRNRVEFLPLDRQASLVS